MSLLPKNSSQLERNIEQALDKKLDVVNRDVWNPDKCPEHLLPQLAWALAVEHWDSNWPEAQKREMIKKQVFVHRKKGTRAAVEEAIRAVRGGDDVIIKEWHEDPENIAVGEFAITYKSQNLPIDIQELVTLLPAINAAKNVRSKIKDIEVTSTVEAPQKLLAVSRVATRVQSAPWLISSVVEHTAAQRLLVSRQSVAIKSGPWAI